jgi:hypothetical protein
MSRTKLLNIAGIAVAAVLVASWGVGAFWTAGSSPVNTARDPHQPVTTAAPLSPEAAHVQQRRRHHRHGPTAPPSATGPTAASHGPRTASAHPDAPSGAHTTHPGSPSASPTGTRGPTSTPTPTPTPTPSPSPSDVLGGILGGIGLGG